jgi:hypothetical protein
MPRPKIVLKLNGNASRQVALRGGNRKGTTEMRSAVSGLLGALGVVASVNASPAVPNIGDHNPNLIPAASGCGLGFYRTAEGCVSYRYGFLVPGTAIYPYSWYYPHYWGAYYYPYSGSYSYYGSGNGPNTKPSGPGASAGNAE